MLKFISDLNIYGLLLLSMAFLWMPSSLICLIKIFKDKIKKFQNRKYISKLIIPNLVLITGIYHESIFIYEENLGYLMGIIFILSWSVFSHLYITYKILFYKSINQK